MNEEEDAEPVENIHCQRVRSMSHDISTSSSSQ